MKNNGLVLDWDDLFDPILLVQHLNELRYHTILDVNINEQMKKTELITEYNSAKRSQNSQAVFIPNIVNYENHKVTFTLSKTINIKNLQIYDFLVNNCPYFVNWFNFDNENTIVDIYYQKTIDIIRDYNSAISDSLKDINLIKMILNNENYQDMLSFIALTAIVKNFYRDEKSTFSLNKPAHLHKLIKLCHKFSDIITDIKNLHDFNIISSPRSSEIIVPGRYRKTSLKFVEFKMLGNKILETGLFKTYENNLELKLLSKIYNLE